MPNRTDTPPKKASKTKKPEQTPPLPQFSDVIAIAGNSGLPAPFRTLSLLKQVPKNMTNRSPLNCRLKSRLNRLFSRNDRLKRYFLLAWTPLPREPRNGSLNGQSEPVLRPEYLMSRASGSTCLARPVRCGGDEWDPIIIEMSRYGNEAGFIRVRILPVIITHR
jgi:hypothetical protein